MSTAQNPKESLMSIYIKRAYWAVSNIHNKVFFNRAGETYITPDREDEIVALLTEQSPVEVALLRITREIVKKAEEEQPEKKVKITKQNENKIIVEPIAGKMQTKEEVQLSQLIKTSKGQEELHKVIQEKKTEEETNSRKELQEDTESSQSKVSIKV